MKLLRSFFHTGTLPPSLNETLLALIPKKEGPTQTSHFRPISLCNVFYKIISSIIVRRIRPYLEKLISPYQNAFILKRHIQENILHTHEIFHTMRKTKNKNGAFALKIDLSKAYDQLEWPFLQWVLEQHNFPPHLIKCVTTVRYKVLVNGTASTHITPTRGLRRGALFVYHEFGCPLKEL